MKIACMFLVIGVVTAFVFKFFFGSEHSLNLAMCVFIGSASALIGGLVGFLVGRGAGAPWLGFLTAFALAAASLTAYEYLTVDRPHEKHFVERVT